MQLVPGLRMRASAASAKRLKKQIAAHGRSNMVSSVFAFRGGGSRQIIDFRKIKKKLPPTFLLGVMTDTLVKKSRVTLIDSQSDAYSSLLLSPKVGEAELLLVPAETGGLAMAKLLTATIVSMWLIDNGRGLEISVLDSGVVTITRRADEKTRIYLATYRTHGSPPCRPRHFNPKLLRSLTWMADLRAIVSADRHKAWRGAQLPREAETTLVATTTQEDAPAWKAFFGTATELVVDGFDKHHSPHGSIGKHQKNPGRGATRAEALQ